jgi:outer membrane protein assembly factor BamB
LAQTAASIGSLFVQFLQNKGLFLPEDLDEERLRVQSTDAPGRQVLRPEVPGRGRRNSVMPDHRCTREYHFLAADFFLLRHNAGMRTREGSARHSGREDITRQQFLGKTVAGLVGAVLLTPSRAIIPAAAQHGGTMISSNKLGGTGWTRFRGPNGAGVAADRGYPPELGAQTLLWRRSFPAGRSSPILTSSSIFLTGEREDRPIVLCLDRTTGQTVWERYIETSRREPRHRLNHNAAATAVTDGENVYAFFGDYGLVSYTSDGQERWQAPLGPFTSGWGAASSPVLVDGAVVIPLEGYGDSYVAAFEQRTGKQRWRMDRDPMSHNYSTPILRTGRDGIQEVLILGPRRLTAYDPRTGQERWTAKVPGGSIVSTPALHDDILVATSYAVDSYPAFSEWDKNGDGVLTEDEFGQLGPVLRRVARSMGNKDGVISEGEWNEAYGDLSVQVAGRPAVTVLRLPNRETEKLEPEPLWTHHRNVPYVPSPLFYEGVLYLVANGVIITTMDLETGQVAKVGRIPGVLGNCYASPVAADGKLFVVSEEGNAAVIRAGRQWEVLSANSLGEECYATPALSEGRVFVRTLESLACFGNPPS